MKLLFVFCFTRRSYSAGGSLLALVLFLPLFSLAQPYEKAYVDTAIRHEWELSDPAMLKMLTSSGEPFLKALITFGDRGAFYNGTNPSLEWSFHAKTQELEIADMEELSVKGYKLKQLDAEILILLIGKQEIIFKRKR